MYWLFEQQKFSTFWKTSGSDDTEEEEEEDKLGLFDGCDWAAAIAALPPDGEDCNKWINCTYMVLSLRTETEKTAVAKKLTNNNICIALNFIVFF